uniref:Uncharacterized protein n=1 Tax=Rhizophora mucronata TaxID=61149 RepID=A0A2P2Q1N2_RHIMU
MQNMVIQKISTTSNMSTILLHPAWLVKFHSWK